MFLPICSLYILRNFRPVMGGQIWPAEHLRSSRDLSWPAMWVFPSKRPPDHTNILVQWPCHSFGHLFDGALPQPCPLLGGQGKQLQPEIVILDDSRHRRLSFQDHNKCHSPEVDRWSWSSCECSRYVSLSFWVYSIIFEALPKILCSTNFLFLYLHNNIFLIWQKESQFYCCFNVCFLHSFKSNFTVWFLMIKKVQ